MYRHIIIQTSKSDPCQGIHKKDLGQASLSIRMLLVSSLQLNGHHREAGNSVYWLWILVLVTCDLAMCLGTQPTLRTADVDVVLGMLHFFLCSFHLHTIIILMLNMDWHLPSVSISDKYSNFKLFQTTCTAVILQDPPSSSQCLSR